VERTAVVVVVEILAAVFLKHEERFVLLLGILLPLPLILDPSSLHVQRVP
jgi:hypothetical protein